MTITLRMLRDTNAGAFTSAAESWGNIAAAVDARLDEFTAESRPLPTVWPSGTDAAKRAVELRNEMNAAYEPCRKISGALRTHADTVVRLQGMLGAIVDECAGRNITVDLQSGTTRYSGPSIPDPMLAARVSGWIKDYDAQLNDLEVKANRLDEETRTVIRSGLPGGTRKPGGGTGPASRPPSRPAPSGGPSHGGSSGGPSGGGSASGEGAASGGGGASGGSGVSPVRARDPEQLAPPAQERANRDIPTPPVPERPEPLAPVARERTIPEVPAPPPAPEKPSIPPTVPQDGLAEIGRPFELPLRTEAPRFIDPIFAAIGAALSPGTPLAVTPALADGVPLIPPPTLADGMPLSPPPTLADGMPFAAVAPEAPAVPGPALAEFPDRNVPSEFQRWIDEISSRRDQ